MMKPILIVFPVLFLFAVKTSSAMQPDTGRYFTSFDGVKIYYEVRGKGNAVVLIHGFSGSSQGWKTGKLYGDLLHAGYKVIIMDLRGNGRSDKPHNDEAYANNAEAKDIMGLVTWLNIKSYDVVGYSRGSIIASSLMVMDTRVDRTVLGGMGDGYTDPKWPRRIHAYRALMGDTSFHDVDAMVNYIRSQSFDISALALQQKYQPSTSPGQLAAIKTPVLIIRGNSDQENGSETGLQRMIPGSKLAYVPGDHNTAPKNGQFSDAVLQFIK